jgi:hypothetical protein
VIPEVLSSKTSGSGIFDELLEKRQEEDLNPGI